MGKRIIAEIPIYAFPPNEFRKRWIRQKKRKYIAMGYSKEEVEKYDKKAYSQRSEWKYSKLVGMLYLCVKGDDSIYFGLYCRDGNQKISIRTDCYASFPDRCTDVSRKLIVFKNDTNEKIRQGIKARIKDIQHLEMIDNFYIDCEAFDNIAVAVNFKKFLNFE